VILAANPETAPNVLPMIPVKFCIFIGMNVGGMIGWSLGEQFGVMIAFIISSLGSVAGVFAGWKLARHFLG
jgi:uncharacterized protein YcfJ